MRPSDSPTIWSNSITPSPTSIRTGSITLTQLTGTHPDLVWSAIPTGQVQPVRSEFSRVIRWWSDRVESRFVAADRMRRRRAPSERRDQLDRERGDRVVVPRRSVAPRGPAGTCSRPDRHRDWCDPSSVERSPPRSTGGHGARGADRGVPRRAGDRRTARADDVRRVRSRRRVRIGRDVGRRCAVGAPATEERPPRGVTSTATVLDADR